MRHAHPLVRFAALAVVLPGLAGPIIRGETRPEDPIRGARIESPDSIGEARAVVEQERRDRKLIRRLLSEDLGERRFSFGAVIAAVAGTEVLPLDRDQGVHRRLIGTIEEVVADAREELGREDSPAREHARINEVSAHFENAILEGLDARPGLSCGIPPTREGGHQRSGYPDLRLVDEASGQVFYLDPKLVGPGLWDSSLRSFYFEPQDETLKITEDAVHLVIGIAHDGRDGAWSFPDSKIVDLSSLDVRLKAEFQASNRDLYRDRSEELSE